MKDKTIFITVPAYNDPALIRTIEGALDNALFPERLFFCIGMQYHDDRMPDISKYLDNPNFKFLFYDVDTRPGVYWVRREMAEQHNGQDYFLMIDSHMVFAKYWDATLINDYDALVRLHGEKTVLSRPTMKHVGSTFDNGFVTDAVYWGITPNNDLNVIDRTISPAADSEPWDGTRYRRSFQSCSHFFFTNKNYLKDVGFFPIIRSYTEEYTISIASFLSGWDYYYNTEYIPIGHDDEETTMAIYGKPMYTMGQGKPYQALYESPDERVEMAKFQFLDSSSVFKVKNQRRTIEEFYDLNPQLKDIRQMYIAMLGL